MSRVFLSYSSQDRDFARDLHRHRFCGHYSGGVFWVDAERGLVSLPEQVSRPAEIKIDGRLPPEEQLADLWRILGQRRASLVVPRLALGWRIRPLQGQEGVNPKSCPSCYDLHSSQAIQLYPHDFEPVVG